ncbi:MAG TPA: hypothetical protein VGB79_14520 [Allosphingosinicella sp.]|jgi:hypothetical protein
MTPVDESTWRNRFITLQLTRIGGTAIVMIGLYVWYSDAVAPGGTIVLGLPLALIGLVVSFWGPKHLSRKWRRQDGR